MHRAPTLGLRSTGLLCVYPIVPLLDTVVTLRSEVTMSAYTNKHALVLDVGTRYVKAGVSEERAPRCVVAWDVAQLLAERVDLETLRAYLARQLHHVCFDVMRVNPRHRRVVVCEDVLGPRRLREALVDVLFVDLKVASVTLEPSAIAALYATTHHTALVVDCGYSEIRLLPVYKGIPLLYSYTCVPGGFKSCYDRLVDSISARELSLTDSFVESILERACFVQPIQNHIMDVADTSFRSEGRREVMVSAAMRSEAYEGIFSGDEKADSSLMRSVTELLQKLPIDVRGPMVENILLIGGVAMVPGFCTRLREEMEAALDQEQPQISKRVSVVRPHFPRNVLAWVGASIFASVEGANDSTISASQYASSGTKSLSDWLSIAETEI